MMFDALDLPLDESSMNDADFMGSNSFGNGDPSEASYTLAEVMDQESVANLEGIEDAAAGAADAVEAVDLGWTGKIFKHVKKMWDETGEEMNITDAADQMSSFVANESSHNMSGVLLPAKTQLYVMIFFLHDTTLTLFPSPV